jgi:hypothetical protein
VVGRWEEALKRRKEDALRRRKEDALRRREAKGREKEREKAPYEALSQGAKDEKAGCRVVNNSSFIS